MGEIALRRFFLAVFCALALSLSALAADAALPSLEAAVDVAGSVGVCEVTMTAGGGFFRTRRPACSSRSGRTRATSRWPGGAVEQVLQDGVTCLKLEQSCRLRRRAAAAPVQLYAAVPCGRGRGRPADYRLSLPETGWDYAIDSYTLTMTFPAEVTNAPEWTSGYYGDVVDNYLDIRTQENTVTAKSTAAMRDHETLTVAVRVARRIRSICATSPARRPGSTASPFWCCWRRPWRSGSCACAAG